ncbi:MAG: TRAP transporter small permease [Sulfitobacter dubius]
MKPMILSIASAVDRTLLLVLQLLLCAIVIATFSQVILRYVFSSPTVWSEEVARVCFVWLTFLGAAVLAGRGENLAIDLFEGRLSGPQRHLIAKLWAMAGILFLSITAVASWTLIGIAQNQVLPASDLPVSILYLAPCVGALVGIALSLASLCDDTSGAT